MSHGEPTSVIPAPLIPMLGVAYLILQIAPGAGEAARAAADGMPVAPAIWQTVRDACNVGVVGALAAFLWHVRSPARDLIVAMTGLVVQLRDTLPRIEELAKRHDTALDDLRRHADRTNDRLEQWIGTRHDHLSED